MKSTYRIGDDIVISDGQSKIQFEIIDVGVRNITLKDKLRNIESDRAVAEIDELIVAGTAEIMQRRLAEREIVRPNAMDFSSYPEKSKQLARERYKFVEHILQLNLPSKSVGSISPVIEQVWISEKFEQIKKKPSERSVQRWLKEYRVSGESIRALLPKHADKGNREPKVDPLIEPYILSAIEHFKQLERPTVASSYDHLTTLIDYENAGISDPNKKMKVITQRAFTKRLEKLAPKEVMLARMGREETNKHFRTAKQTQDISLILQVVESDHTQLDLFIVDSKSSLVLGRPHVTALIDKKSKSVLGFYIGFEKPSYLSIARALKHAILPKNYLKEKYPEVENEWPCYGIPRILSVDRGKDFSSVALSDTCLDLNIRIHRNPGKHPWYKGSIESFFKSLNGDLLNDLKGKVFPNIVDTNLYNPKKHSVITMDLFLKIFHKWVVDIYHQKKVSKGRIIPRVSWEQDLDKVPRRVMNKNALDIVLAETEFRKNTKDGIVLDHIWYSSEELTNIRSVMGSQKVQIKFNREDLGYIHVLDERNKRDKTFIKVPAIEKNYAQGLSKHQHQVIVKFNRKYLDEQVNLETLAVAKMKIKQMIKDYLEKVGDKATATAQNVARYTDTGQKSDQSVTSSVQDYLDDEGYQGVPSPQETNRTTVLNKEPEELFDGSNNSLPNDSEFWD